MLKDRRKQGQKNALIGFAMGLAISAALFLPALFN